MEDSNIFLLITLEYYFFLSDLKSEVEGYAKLIAVS